MKYHYFILILFFLSCICPEVGSQELIKTHTPKRQTGQTDVVGLKCEPIPLVRVGFIGVGMRGRAAVERFVHLEGVIVKAFCDMYPQNIEHCQSVLKKNGMSKATEYLGADAWKQLCSRDDIDLVYICTDWLTHTPMSVYAMEKGKHVAVEVPAATTVEECWQLVNTAEKTRRHCIMLENCCYDFFELATLNMAQQGVFGNVTYGEGAYIHDMNDFLISGNIGSKEPHNSWRQKYNVKHTGNPYPTHGLGPICQIMNIHRGDKLNSLVSLSTNQFGLTESSKEKYKKDSPQANQEYKMGDMNVSLIRTEKGKLIMVQHDVTSPRPYSRIHLLSGTKGYAQKWPVEQIALKPNAHDPMPKADMDSLLALYEHPFSKEIGERARKVGGHGGMDFIMDYRLIYCLQNGLPLDMDVYDAAEWSCLVDLCEKSVLNNGAPVEIPDFTRGAWNKLKGLQFAD
ncbi:MAG: Gfo/Idh/MocA family oxidoreductase [Dysgonomonas sp.]|nr:Gfo/Idh/MocA family oxidoreductase [Dysgonomonas sp.]